MKPEPKRLYAIAQQLRMIADQLDHGVTETELDDIVGELDKLVVVLPTY